MKRNHSFQKIDQNLNLPKNKKNLSNSSDNFEFTFWMGDFNYRIDLED
jgi:hypothetical protein